jgi:Insertion element 4 transposase N-terminal/Transposase DDE domain
MNQKDVGRLTDHVSLGALTRIVPRYVVDEVLAQTGAREKRSRSLPAHVVVYFVLALALFTDGYEEVVRKLVNGLRFARTWSREWSPPTTGALSQARARLGAAPLQALFEAVAVPLAKPGTPGAWLRSWRLMAIDGVMIDVPDTATNFAYYDKPQGGTRRPFPQVRAVGLCEVGTHGLIAAELGTIHQGERALASKLTSTIGPEMLVLADRGFFSYDLWRDYMAADAALLWRLSATMKLKPMTFLADGSYLAEIVRKSVRGGCTRIALADIGDLQLATHIPVRVIEYRVEDDTTTSETFQLITTILDPQDASADELAAAYHQRWVATRGHTLRVNSQIGGPTLSVV